VTPNSSAISRIVQVWSDLLRVAVGVVMAAIVLYVYVNVKH
jgi:hypothetical protein